MIEPHGGSLVNGYNSDAERIKTRAINAPTVRMNRTAWLDANLIANGGFSPLTGFMKQAEVDSVIDNMRLPDGTVWSLPILLQVSRRKAESLELHEDVELLSPTGELFGILELEEIYKIDMRRICEDVFGANWHNGGDHPGVLKFAQNGSYALAGTIRAIRPVKQQKQLLSPLETRLYIQGVGWKTITAFQTRNPLHRAHEYLLRCALEVSDGLFVHPLVGETKADDIPASVRWKTYRAILDRYFPATRILLSPFPAAMRYAGPREAIHHAIARKNYGATHFIVGRDHAGVGDFYGTYEAQEIFDEFSPDEIGISILKFEHAFYDKSLKMMATKKTTRSSSDSWVHLSGTKVRELLRSGGKIPEELSRPEVVSILREFYQQS